MDVAKKNLSEIRFRRWCLTIWKSERFPDKDALAQELCKVKVKFLIIGDELTKNDKPHFQTYVEFENGRSFNSLEKQFKGCGHFAEAKGSAQQNIEYCSKTDASPLRIGYVNLVNENLSKGDIASNLIDIMISFEVNECVSLYELICMYPQFADYIVNHYSVLEKIYSDIKKDKYKFAGHPLQKQIDLPF